jgi:hypothetical protein
MIGKRNLAVAVATLLMISCAKTDDAAEEQPADTATMGAEATPAAVAGDPTGTWDMRSVPASGTDTTATTYQLKVDNGTWTLQFPNREPIAARVTADGDSFVMDAGPYSSVRRSGKMVSTHGVFRVSGDQMTGETTATYQGAPNDTLHLTTTGTRVK